MTSTHDKAEFCSIPEAIAEIQAGRFVVLVDDEDRENEGDLVIAAEFIDPEKVNFMLTHGRGTLCVALSRQLCNDLRLDPQSSMNTTRFGTAFTTTVDAAPRFGVTTGVSASDRAITIKRLVDESARPDDFARPGHINPLIARDGGVLVRAGQTEGSVDLCRLAGLRHGAAIIEILNPDGTMARVPQLTEFCGEHGIKMCSVAGLIEHRTQLERFVERVETIQIANVFGQWDLFAYRSPVDEGTHLALTMGGIGAIDADGLIAQQTEPLLVRVHSECLTGDVFGSMRCDCGQQLAAAMEMITNAGRGVIVYLRQEGRGIGLLNKLHAYSLQDAGLDTVEANQALGQPADRRDYGLGAQILRDLGISQMRILTNNPKKISRLSVFGLEVVEQIAIEMEPNEFNRRYLAVKRQKMGHVLKKGFGDRD